MNELTHWGRVTHICVSNLTIIGSDNGLSPVLETKVGPSVRDQQFLVRTSNFLHISLQINVWISQDPDQDRQLFQLSHEPCLSPGWRQAIIWTNDGQLLIGPLGTNFSEILIEFLIFSFKKMRLKVLFAKRRPFCLGLNELTHCGLLTVWYH